MSRVGIIQSNFLPWRGYFDFIQEVDTFIILEDVQYTKRDWRNRNRLRSLDTDTQWLSVPVIARRDTNIDEVIIDRTQRWPSKALSYLEYNYKKSPFFNDYFDHIEKIFGLNDDRLVDLNYKLIRAICSWLGINTKLIRSTELDTHGKKEQKLINLVKSVNGNSYLSGPSAKNYIIEENWQRNEIKLSYKNYNGYPNYPQIAEPFVSDVSIIDLLFMVGDAAPDYIWGKYRAPEQ